MLVMNDAQFMANKNPDAPFAILIVSKASRVDVEKGTDCLYEFLVEITTIRLNPAAVMAWELSNPPSCWPPQDYGLTMEDYERRKEERAKRREAFNSQIKADLGIDDAWGKSCEAEGSYTIAKIIGDYFAVVTMRQIRKRPRETAKAEQEAADNE